MGMHVSIKRSFNNKLQRLATSKFSSGTTNDKHLDQVAPLMEKKDMLENENVWMLFTHPVLRGYPADLPPPSIWEVDEEEEFEEVKPLSEKKKKMILKIAKTVKGLAEQLN